MSILNRFVKKNGSTKFKYGFEVTGEKGIFTEYLKRIPQCDCGVEEIYLELVSKDEIRSLVCEEFGECALQKINKGSPETEIKDEAYFIKIESARACIFAMRPISFIYAAENIISNMVDGEIFCGAVYNYPDKEFRGLKAFLPRRENFDYFYKLIDFCLAYGLNTIVLEVGGAMEYKSHPEINDGWIEYCNMFKETPGKSVEYQNSFDFLKNSIHWENGGGSFLKQEEVKELVKYCKDRGINVIPEQPMMSHSDYLLFKHKEFAEREEDPTPDAYCPKNEGVLKLCTDLLDEIIEVFEPQIIHIGHDELYSVGLCEKCKGEDPARLYADDINFYNRYLKRKNIKTMIWCDKLLDAHDKTGQNWGGAERKGYFEDGSLKYFVPATYRSYELIDKDVLLMHWYWSVDSQFDYKLTEKYDFCYGNFTGISMIDADKRMKLKSFGFCVSNWAECEEVLLQRNGIFFHIAYNSMMVWSDSFCSLDYIENIKKVSEDIYKYFNSRTSAQKFITFIHNTSTFKPHMAFVDGAFPVKEEDYVGKYELLFNNGETKSFDIYYGLNIGYSKNTFVQREDSVFDCYEYDKQLFETTYRCRYIPDQNEMFYEYKVPIENHLNLTSWQFIPSGKYDVKIKSVKGS